jgi:DNA polymerase-1
MGVALRPGVGLGLAFPDGSTRSIPCADPCAELAAMPVDVAARWVWWGRETADCLAAAGVSVMRCWDVLTVHRLLAGVWRADVATAWAWLHDLPPAGMPRTGQLDLLSVGTPDAAGSAGDPVQPDGYLRPEWVHGEWAATPERLAVWAALALRAADLQSARLATRGDPERARSTAHAESVAEFVCSELERDGLPFDVVEAERLIGEAIGPRPATTAEEDGRRAERDDAVLSHAPAGGRRPDLRSPADVKALLRRMGFDLPDTRAWRLKLHRADHPLIDALLKWRKAERIATTYGYRWLDEHVRRAADGTARLHGEWSSSDGAAGRMTASAGLHNLPAELRPAVAADPGYVFVHADLGQIEPRVLAAVSGDPALIAATGDDDLYQPVAGRLGVTREAAKVGVLGAMYGGTTGSSGLALPRLREAFPRAMDLLDAAAEQGRRGDPVFTIGGRLVRMWSGEQYDESGVGDIDRARQIAAARGRYARNALIQGAAAEFFKTWAVTFRARALAAGLDARIVLCLHDELLIHVADRDAGRAEEVLRAALQEAAHRWSTGTPAGPAVRFVAVAGSVARWSDAKGAAW